MLVDVTPAAPVDRGEESIRDVTSGRDDEPRRVFAPNSRLDEKVAAAGNECDLLGIVVERGGKDLAHVEVLKADDIDRLHRICIDRPVGHGDVDGIVHAYFAHVGKGRERPAGQLQQRPSPAEGEVLKRGWDLTFKSTKNADYVVGQVWARDGARFFLCDQIRAKMDFTETLRAIQLLSAKWPTAIAKYVEDSANGPAVIGVLSNTIPGIISIRPDGSKEARTHAISPFVEAGNVWLPSPSSAPWVDSFVEECASFPRGAHDDCVDAMSQALSHMGGGQAPQELWTRAKELEYREFALISPF